MNTAQVLKINSALSSRPFYVKLGTLENPSIDTIASLAIQQLNAQGKPLEAQQLEQLFDTHQIFNGNQVQGKGTLFDALAKTRTMVGEQPIELAEINLLTSHAGGVEISHINPWNHIECKLDVRCNGEVLTPGSIEFYTNEPITSPETFLDFLGEHWKQIKIAIQTPEPTPEEYLN